MHDVWQFLVICWATGTLVRSVCALAIVPLLAWGAIRLLMPKIAAMGHDPSWQAPLAAAAAAIPGGLLVTLALLGLMGGLHAACLETITGRVVFSLIVAVAVLAFARALVLAGRRSGEAATLLRWSSAPSERLAAIGSRLQIVTRQLPDERPFCALAGTLRPVVLVSQGALARLTDAELEAALLHERGHARQGDQWIAAALTFLVDLLPLPAMNLVAMYRHAREVAADRHAVASAEAHDLAAALLYFIRSETVPTASAALAGRTGVKARLHLLLGEVAPARVSPAQRFVLIGALVVILGAGLAPAVAAVREPVPCRMSAPDTER